MKRFLGIFVSAACVMAAESREPAPYLLRAWSGAKATPLLDTDVEKYFERIAALRKRDVLLAARDYHRFMRDYGDRPCTWRGMIVPVRRRVYGIFKEDGGLARAYAQRYGRAAEDGCRRARRRGDAGMMMETVESYFPAPGTLDALSFLAFHHFDHADFDRAVLCIDMMKQARRLPPRLVSLSRAVRLLRERERGRGVRRRIVVSAGKPLWIGGVETSTVYPADLASYRPLPVVYSAAVAGGRVVVNSGRNVYAYDEATGRHAWRPGEGHGVSTVSLARGDVVRGDRVRGVGTGNTGTLAGGGGYTGDVRVEGGVVYTVFGGYTASRLGIYRLSSGIPVLPRDALGVGLAGREEKKRPGRGIWRFSRGAAVWNRTIYLVLLYADSREVRACGVAYAWERKEVVWRRELFAVEMRYGFPPSSLLTVTVAKEGPYLVFFSAFGIVGVYRARDGGLVWQRRFVRPPGMREVVSPRFPGRISFLVPVLTSSHVLVEGPRRGFVSVFSLPGGEKAGEVDLGGDPLWGIPVGRDMVCAVKRRRGDVDLVYVDVGRGEAERLAGGAGEFPGDTAGGYLYCCAGDGELVEVDLAAKRCTGRKRLGMCRFPGRVLIGKNLYVVNASGIYAYAYE